MSDFLELLANAREGPEPLEYSKLCGELTAESAQEFYALDVPAAHEDRIHLVDGKLLTWHGPRMASSLTQLSALLRF
jgi:hypothetical protein